MATYIALTILVITSVAYGHGHKGSEGRGENGRNREGCNDHGFVVAEEFIRNLTDVQRQALFNITHNRNLTKSELQSQISSWSDGLSSEEKILYDNITATLQQLKANFSQTLQDAIAKLNDTTAIAVANEIVALINNQSISYAQTFEAIRLLIDSQNSSSVKKELESVLPHAHGSSGSQDPFLGGGKHGGDHENSGHGGNHGNSRHEGMHRNSERRNKRKAKQIRAKRLN